MAVSVNGVGGKDVCVCTTVTDINGCMTEVIGDV